MSLESVLLDEEGPEKGRDLPKVTQLGASQGTSGVPSEKWEEEPKMGFAHLAPTHAHLLPGSPRSPPLPYPTPTLSFLLGLVPSQAGDSPVGKDFFPRDLNIQSPSSPSLSKNPPVTNLSESQLEDDKG